MASNRFDPPAVIGRTPVEAMPERMIHRGEEWVTLVPVDERDIRLWEFSLTTGHLIQTAGDNQGKGGV